MKESIKLQVKEFFDERGLRVVNYETARKTKFNHELFFVLAIEFIVLAVIVAFAAYLRREQAFSDCLHYFKGQDLDSVLRACEVIIYG